MTQEEQIRFIIPGDKTTMFVEVKRLDPLLPKYQVNRFDTRIAADKIRQFPFKLPLTGVRKEDVLKGTSVYWKFTAPNGFAIQISSRAGSYLPSADEEGNLKIPEPAYDATQFELGWRNCEWHLRRKSDAAFIDAYCAEAGNAAFATQEKDLLWVPYNQFIAELAESAALPEILEVPESVRPEQRPRLRHRDRGDDRHPKEAVLRGGSRCTPLPSDVYYYRGPDDPRPVGGSGTPDNDDIPF